MYQVGDKVVYPVHGAGVVEGIESREVAGRERDYYVLQLPYSGLRLLVPLEEAEKVGLREIMPLEELGPVLGLLEEGPSQPEEQASRLGDKWNKRQRGELEAIKSGNVYELAATVRELGQRDRRRPLAAGERQLFEQAREILFSELWLAADSAGEKGAETDRLSERIRALLAE